MKILINVILLVSLLFSCNKEELPIDRFPIKYRFYNCGDSTITKVVMNCVTAYPNEHEVYWNGMGKWRPLPINSDDQPLMDVDSILFTPLNYVYIGCSYRFIVSIHHIDSLGNGHYQTYEKIGTINNSQDNIITFSWPKDTLTFQKSK